MTKTASNIGFLLCALAALGIYYLMFEFRYLWYVESGQAVLLRSIFAGSVAVIVVLWLAWPSRIAVALVAALGMFFPHLLFDSGRALDLASIGLALIPMSLLVLATHLRRGAKMPVPA